MYAIVEPAGCSVRRGAVQIRIDLFLDKEDKRYKDYLVPQIEGEPVEAPFHTHFIQISPDVTDVELRTKMKEVLDGFGGEFEKGNDIVDYWHRIKKPAYQPFKVNVGEEKAVFKELREDRKPENLSDSMALHLTRATLKGLDIAARKDQFKVVK